MQKLYKSNSYVYVLHVIHGWDALGTDPFSKRAVTLLHLTTNCVWDMLSCRRSVKHNRHETRQGESQFIEEGTPEMARMWNSKRPGCPLLSPTPGTVHRGSGIWVIPPGIRTSTSCPSSLFCFRETPHPPPPPHTYIMSYKISTWSRLLLQPETRDGLVCRLQRLCVKQHEQRSDALCANTGANRLWSDRAVQNTNVHSCVEQQPCASPLMSTSRENFGVYYKFCGLSSVIFFHGRRCFFHHNTKLSLL